MEPEFLAFSRIPLFEALGVGARRILVFSGETIMLREGDILFRQGDPSDGGYFVLNGSIELTKATAANVVRKDIGCFSLIGELALISQTERTSTAVAKTSANVLKISRNLFHRVLLDHPDDARKVRKILADRLRTAAEVLNGARGTAFV